MKRLKIAGCLFVGAASVFVGYIASLWFSLRAEERLKFPGGFFWPVFRMEWRTFLFAIPLQALTIVFAAFASLLVLVGGSSVIASLFSSKNLEATVGVAEKLVSSISKVDARMVEAPPYIVILIAFGGLVVGVIAAHHRTQKGNSANHEKKTLITERNFFRVLRTVRRKNEETCLVLLEAVSRLVGVAQVEYAEGQGYWKFFSRIDKRRRKKLIFILYKRYFDVIADLYNRARKKPPAREIHARQAFYPLLELLGRRKLRSELKRLHSQVLAEEEIEKDSEPATDGTKVEDTIDDSASLAQRQ